MSTNQNNRRNSDVTFTARASDVAALERRLHECRGSDDYVAVIHALVATRHPAAIRVLASLLDSTGPIAEEAIVSLVTFGEAAIPAMRECADSLDYEMIRHAHRVLAALGDETSKQWLRDDDEERTAAYRERKGFTEHESLFLRTVVANEVSKAKRTA
jgi:hypothetical protein